MAVTSYPAKERAVVELASHARTSHYNSLMACAGLERTGWVIRPFYMLNKLGVSSCSRDKFSTYFIFGCLGENWCALHQSLDGDYGDRGLVRSGLREFAKCRATT